MNPPPAQTAMCRVCTGTDRQLIPFAQFDTDRKVYRLAEAIAAVGGVRVANDDGLPQHCCVRCLRAIESAYKIQRLCQESDRKLREMFRADQLVEVKKENEEANETEEFLFEVEIETPMADAKEEFPASYEMKEEVDDGLKIDGGASSSDLNLDLVKEEIHIDDQEDVFWYEDGNSMECEETADDAANEDVCYEKIPVEGFRCCGCKQDFETKDELLAHRDTVHIGRKLSREQLEHRVQCDVCFKVVTQHRMLLMHQQRVKFEYRCRTCGERRINRIRIINHFRIKHALIVGGACICCGCEESFNSPEELAAHSEAVHLPKRPPPDPNRTVVCDVCYASYKYERGLLIHKTRFTKAGQKFQCQECGKFFRYSRALKEHMKTHVRTQCHLCPVNKSSHKALLKHLAEHKTPDNRYKCLVCGLTYRAPQGLRHHGMDHTGERPHCCPQCPSTFTKAAQLTRHIKAHRNQRDHQCGLCNAKFVDPSNLNQHVKYYHLKERPLVCFFCDYSFVKGYDRRRHMENNHAAELAANPKLEAEMRVKIGGRRKNENL
uniref:Putative c2h2-type zn-finger protein n=1 Tax=Culex tarsalis TaxID=7177 RepID=A0A1Q3F6J2_CULTA